MRQKQEKRAQKTTVTAPCGPISRQERKEARAAIVKLFQENEVLAYSDIMERTDLGLGVVLEVCEELEAEGRVTSAEQ